MHMSACAHARVHARIHARVTHTYVHVYMHMHAYRLPLRHAAAVVPLLKHGGRVGNRGRSCGTVQHFFDMAQKRKRDPDAKPAAKAKAKAKTSGPAQPAGPGPEPKAARDPNAAFFKQVEGAAQKIKAHAAFSDSFTLRSLTPMKFNMCPALSLRRHRLLPG